MFVSALAALAIAASPAGPAELKPEDRADLQCMAVAIYTISVIDDPSARSAMVAGATYYYGRLQGRRPEVDWLQQFQDYARTNPLAEMEANRIRCAEEIRDVGQAFTAAGTALADG